MLLCEVTRYEVPHTANMLTGKGSLGAGRLRESVADTAGRSAAPLVVSLLVVSLATERWTHGLLAAGVRRAIYGGTRTELGTAEIEADTNASGRVSRETVWILWTVITMTNGDVSPVHAPADTHWSGRRGRGCSFPRAGLQNTQG